MANGNSVPASRLRIAASAQSRSSASVSGRAIVQRQIAGSSADLGQSGDVVEAERLEADDPTLERDGFDARGDGHAAIVRHAAEASGRGR